MILNYRDETGQIVNADGICPYPVTQFRRRMRLQLLTGTIAASSSLAFVQADHTIQLPTDFRPGIVAINLGCHPATISNTELRAALICARFDNTDTILTPWYVLSTFNGNFTGQFTSLASAPSGLTLGTAAGNLLQLQAASMQIPLVLPERSSTDYLRVGFLIRNSNASTAIDRAFLWAEFMGA